MKDKLKQIDIFSTLDDKSLDKVVDICSIKKLNKSEILFYEGDKANYFYILLDGSLKLYKMGIKSNEVVLHYFIKPTMVAEMATLENINFPATATVMSDDTQVAMIQKEKFLEILKENSILSFQIIKSLTKKIKTLEMAINRNLIFDATAKVCSLLKENNELLIVNKNIQIANILNMAPETLSRVLKKLRELDIIDGDNKLLDSSKLDMFLEF